MRNKKGFTLVEMLAVIVILAIVMIIAVPVIQDALSSSNQGMNEFEKKTIKDGAETMVLEIINCDLDSNIYNVLGISNSLTCSEVNNLVVGKTITISIQNMKTYGFLNDVGGRCQGDILVTTDAESYQVTVDTDSVTCN